MPGVKKVMHQVLDEVKYVKKCVETLVKSADRRDKIAKATEAYFDLGYNICKKEGMKNAGRAIHDARTVFSLVNILAGIIPATVENYSTAIDIVKNAIRPQDNEGNAISRSEVVIPKSGAKDRFGELADLHSYKGISGMITGFIFEIAQGNAGVAYALGFGVFRHMKFWGDLFKGEKVSTIGKNGFIWSMAVQHIFVVGANTVNLIREAVLFKKNKDYLNRSEEEINYLMSKGFKDKNDVLKTFKGDFVIVIVDSVLVYGEKGFEIAKDIITIAKIKCHPLIAAIIHAAIGTFSLALAVERTVAELRRKDIGTEHNTNQKDAYISQIRALQPQNHES